MKYFHYTLFALFLLISTAYSQESNQANVSETKIKIIIDTNLNYYDLGKQDAKKYYKHTGPFAGSFASSLIFPPIGLITSISIAIPAPKEQNFGIPYSKKELFLVDSYVDGYKKKAHQKKALMTFAGFATGTAFFVAGLAMTGYIQLK